MDEDKQIVAGAAAVFPRLEALLLEIINPGVIWHPQYGQTDVKILFKLFFCPQRSAEEWCSICVPGFWPTQSQWVHFQSHWDQVTWPWTRSPLNSTPLLMFFFMHFGHYCRQAAWCWIEATGQPSFAPLDSTWSVSLQEKLQLSLEHCQ